MKVLKLIVIASFFSSLALADNPVVPPFPAAKKLGIQVEPPKYNGEKPRYVVFMIHGIAGDETTFPNLDKALQTHLDHYQPGYNNEVVLFTYDTGGKRLQHVLDPKTHKAKIDEHGQLVKVEKDATTYWFAVDFASEMDRYFKKGTPLRPQDKISLVMHSQGGLVGSQWAFNSMIQTKFPPNLLYQGNFFPEYADQIDAAVTLGTPFWGTKQAGAAEQFLDYITKSARVNGAELSDLRYASSKVLDFRRGAIRIDQATHIDQPTNNEQNDDDETDMFKYFRSNVRILNIGGYIPKATITRGKFFLKKSVIHFDENGYLLPAEHPGLTLLKLGGLNLLRAVLSHSHVGLKEIESDGAVGVPSSRLDFLYYKDKEIVDPSQIPETYDVVRANQFHETKFGTFTVLPALHVNPTFPRRNAVIDLDSLAQVPQECITNVGCDHPSLRLVVGHLLGEKTVIQNDAYLKQMTAFTVAINIKTPKSKNPTTAEMFEFHWQTPEGVYVNRATEIYSRDDTTVDDEDNMVLRYGKSEIGKKHHRIAFSGAVEMNSAYNSDDPSKFNKKILKVTISAPGFASRTLEIPVRSTFTTFLDLEMMKERPWNAADVFKQRPIK